MNYKMDRFSQKRIKTANSWRINIQCCCRRYTYPIAEVSESKQGTVSMEYILQMISDRTSPSQRSVSSSNKTQHDFGIELIQKVILFLKEADTIIDLNGTMFLIDWFLSNFRSNRRSNFSQLPRVDSGKDYAEVS